MESVRFDADCAAAPAVNSADSCLLEVEVEIHIVGFHNFRTVPLLFSLRILVE